MPEVYIISSCRTGIGRFQGQFENFSASELGSIVIREAINRAQIQSEDVQQVIMGQVLTGGQGQNPARQAALGAEIPNTSTAFTVNMVCGSGMKSVALGYQAIKSGVCPLIVTGGQECMSAAHHTTHLRGSESGELDLQDTILIDGLMDAFNNIHMGKTAEHVAAEYKVSREAQDEYACRSQQKAEEAIKNGYFQKEIVGVLDKDSRKILDQDQFPKFGSTMERLSIFKPCFVTDGTVTAGNSSGINDGAAAIVLASEDIVKKKKLHPVARIKAIAEEGLDPMIMGLGPVEAIKTVIEQAKWTKEEVDLYELNEAFAATSITVNRTLNLDENKINISGGAIALGHPIGCSGTRIIVTLIHNLQRLGKKKGVAAVCIGGGMGIAIAIEIC